MNAVRNSVLVLSICLLLAACAKDPGDSDLSGTWLCKETSQIFLKSTKGESRFYVTFIKDSVNPDKYSISNIYQLGTNVKVTVVRDGYSLTLSSQTVNKTLFEGKGTINDAYDFITLIYTVDDGGGVDKVTAEYSR